MVVRPNSESVTTTRLSHVVLSPFSRKYLRNAYIAQAMRLWRFACAPVTPPSLSCVSKPVISVPAMMASVLFRMSAAPLSCWKKP